MKFKVNILSIAGYITIAFWLIHLSILLPPPFQESSFDGINKLITELYEKPAELRAGTILEGDKEEVIKKIKISTYLSWLEYFSVVVIGLTSGFLIYKKRKSGRVIAITLFSLLIIDELWVEVKYFRGFSLIIPKYKLLIENLPIHAIYQSIISPIFYLFALIFLLNKKIKSLFVITETKTTS